jgi:hypothetical protein
VADNYQFGAGNSTFVPAVQSQLLIDYTLAADRFPLWNYIDLYPVARTVGYFRKFQNQDQARDVNSPADFTWADGNDAPMGTWNNVEFQFPQYRTQRNAYPFRVGFLAADQADWDYIAVEAAHKAAQAMVDRTFRVANVLTTSGNWPTTNTATATSLAGGKWSAATSTNPYIKLSIMSAVNTIVEQTNGLVQYGDLKLIVNPNGAKTIATSAEFIDFLKQQPSSPEIFEGAGTWNKMFGLPRSLYGVELIVDFTSYVSTTPTTGATTGTRAFAYPDADAIIVTKKPLTSVAGGYFSTLALFSYTPDEMAVEVFTDTLNRRYIGRTLVNDVPLLVAGESGYLITAIS